MFKRLSLALLASFLLMQSAFAADEEIILNEEEQLQIIDFVNGNVMWTMFHEVGHALVDLHEIPVLAKEEDAVDNFATIIMLLLKSSELDQYLKETAYGWFLFDEFAEKAGEELNFSDEHSLDQQRAYQTVCFLYGADQNVFAEFAKLMDVPQERLDRCAYDFGTTLKNWRKVIATFAADENSPKAEVAVVYGDASEPLESYKNFLQAGNMLEYIRDYIIANFKLPEPITLEAQACQTANAYWDPEAKKVILCYELLVEFERLFLFDIKQAIAESN